MREKKAFINKLFRESSRDYKVFFGDNTYVSIGLSEEAIESTIKRTMLAACIPQHLVYAYKKTGIIVNEDGYRNMSREDRAEYDRAIDEYFEMEKKQKSTQ
ncbi:hypothetical protein RFN28_25465 [Mesorhizobium sp. VK24D]|uniref:Uncharacterized protein n=1 Tax=Mesorhizobium album TaxID=3072314 RepID=A0ABU4Y4B3_9HYPH|nr:hypothetical protein [Mesorhizobium sp. VK24D]MDX8481785.1 hypothetical protein [Mesorhizobium sp. VK24D]